VQAVQGFKGVRRVAAAVAVAAAVTGVMGSAAAAATTLPTWRNVYDWAGGDGYAGWHSAASSAQDYGTVAALGGTYGLWLWATGGKKAYTPGDYAEWTYTAPGTTRLADASLSFAYRNKLLAHHCIDVGFRDGAGAVVAHREYCQPPEPPDSQDRVTLALADAAANPTAKVLYVRILVDCGGARTCAKTIPSKDPLTTGGFVRVLGVDMTLVDDDQPTVELSHDDVDAHDDLYTAAVHATDAGSGIKSVRIERVGGSVFAASDAPCDPTHHTDALDARICPADFSLTGSLDIGGLEDGTYEFLATAVDVAGNVGTIRWQVTLNRVSLDVTLSPLAATALDKYTTAAETDFGWNASESIPGAGTRQSFKWRFELGPNQVLESLPGGRIAVVTQGPDEPGSPPDDYSDGPAEDPSTVDGDGTADEDGAAGADDVPVDETGFDAPDAPTPNDPAMDAQLEAIAAAQDTVTDGSVDAVVTAPAVLDAAGTAVPAALSVDGNIVTITISHRDGSYSYPVVAAADLLDDAAQIEDAPAGGRLAASAAAVSCPVRPQILVYGPRGYAQLLAALAANPTPCASYYIVLNSPPQAKRHIDRANLKGVDRVREVCRASWAPKAKEVGARFYPVPEFNWGAWSFWVDRKDPGAPGDPVQRSWRKAGQLFRQYVHDEAGLGVSGGSQCTDPTDGATYTMWEYWTINELPSTWVRPDDPDHTAERTRDHVRQAISGLFFGQRGYSRRRGLPLVIGNGNDLLNVGPYRAGLRSAITSGGFWRALRPMVIYWGQEAYANPYKNLVPGTERQARAKYANAFTLHPALFAWSATGTEPALTKEARTFFAAKYFPLANGYWSRLIVDDPAESPLEKVKAARGYGYTDQIGIDEMKALVSVELYAARRRAAASETESAANRIPHLFVGLSWLDRTSAFGEGEAADLADHVAKTLAAAYDPVNGTARAACFVGGQYWCNLSVTSGESTGPRKVQFNPTWCAFQTWARSAPRPLSLLCSP
jgi:hypothetical protein